MATYNIGPGQTYETFAALVAAVTLQPDDIVDGGGNTFNEFWSLPTYNYTLSNPVTLRNAKINGAFTRNGIGNAGYRCKGWIIEDVEVEECVSGVKFYILDVSATNVQDIIIRDSIVKNCITSGVSISSSSSTTGVVTNCTVQHVTVENCSYNIAITNKAYSNLVEDCLSYNADQFNLYTGAQTLGDNHSNVFINCTSYGAYHPANWASGVAYAKYSRVIGSTRRYMCIQSHTSAADNQPETGANWSSFWVRATTWTGAEGSGIQFDNNSQGNTITKSVIYNNRRGIVPHLSSGCIASYNLVYSNTNEGILNLDPAGHLYSYNNTVSGNNVGLYTYAPGAHYVYAKNNIFTNNATYGISYNSTPGNSDLDYNCLYANTTDGLNNCSATNSVVADPKLRSATDFHLQSTSPCINAGTNTPWASAGAEVTDYDGNPVADATAVYNRQIGGVEKTNVDIGAYNYEPDALRIEDNSPTSLFIAKGGYYNASSPYVWTAPTGSTKVESGTYKEMCDLTLTSNIFGVNGVSVADGTEQATTQYMNVGTLGGIIKNIIS